MQTPVLQQSNMFALPWSQLLLGQSCNKPKFSVGYYLGGKWMLAHHSSQLSIFTQFHFVEKLTIFTDTRCPACPYLKWDLFAQNQWWAPLLLEGCPYFHSATPTTPLIYSGNQPMNVVTSWRTSAWKSVFYFATRSHILKVVKSGFGRIISQHQTQKL